jgi:DNA-binding NarL/FixJ family response regulator
MTEIRVLIADDRPQVRESLQALLETQDGILVVGLARDGREAISLVESLRPTVVLMDLEMPNLDGLAATAFLKAGTQPPGIIALTMHEQPWAEASARRAGADDFVGKSARPEILVQAIREVGRAA